MQSAPRIRDGNAFFGYIWAIAANTYKKFLRKKNRVRYETLDENVDSQEDFVEEMENVQELNALYRELSLLSREYRECTIVHYFDGLSCAETAFRLHISLEMVKYYLFKTRKMLKEGIIMEREFGTRKLPGNILDCAYYTPMTIRELGFIGSTLEEDRLLWALLFMVMRKGAEFLEAGHKDEIFRGAAGTNYGTEYNINDENDLYGHCSVAGYYTVVEAYSAMYAEYGVLPEGNRFLTHLDELRKNVPAIAARETETTVPIISGSQKEAMEHILRQEIQGFCKVYDKLYQYAVRIMRTHAPENTMMEEKRSLLTNSCSFVNVKPLMIEWPYPPIQGVPKRQQQEQIGAVE